jgi:hypothetical protein
VAKHEGVPVGGATCPDCAAKGSLPGSGSAE